MTSRLQIAPHAMHSRVANQLWVNKTPWVYPINGSPTKQVRKQPPEIKKIARFGYNRKLR
jgi:hypothetical protein